MYPSQQIEPFAGALESACRSRWEPFGTLTPLPAPSFRAPRSLLAARCSRRFGLFWSILVYLGLLQRGGLAEQNSILGKVWSCLVTFGQSDNAGVTDGSQTQKTASRSSSPFAVAFSSSAVSASVWKIRPPRATLIPNFVCGLVRAGADLCALVRKRPLRQPLFPKTQDTVRP
jgi:hypothetical protein